MYKQGVLTCLLCKLILLEENLQEKCTTTKQSVIWHLSFAPTISTWQIPSLSMVQVGDGTICMPVWSQFSIISGHTSFISTVCTTASKNSCFTSVKLIVVCLPWDVWLFFGQILFCEKRLYPVSYSIYPFTAKGAIWRPEVITHMGICLAFVNKYFFDSKQSMCLFWNRHTHRVTITRITGAFADYCAFVM